MSNSSNKHNWLFVLIAIICLGWFVYLYINQPPSKPTKNKETVEVIDFSKGSRTRRSSSSIEDLIYAGTPVREGYPNKIKILKNKAFIVGYDEKRKNPAWVAYKVEDCNNSCFFGLERPSHFDTDYRTRARVEHSDYKGSGYDRGHMAPNFAISTRFGKAAQEETFLMSNIVPQKPNLNRGVWKDLEQQIANQYARRLEEVWIITGPIYDDAIPDRFLRNGTEIPDAFYKIVLDEDNGKPVAKAYVIPQSASKRARLSRFSVSIDEVERKTGLDFFTLLDDVVEEGMEQKMVQGL